jgi:hypothetical protein
VYQVALNTHPAPNPYSPGAGARYGAASLHFSAAVSPALSDRSEPREAKFVWSAGAGRARTAESVRTTAVALRERLTQQNARELQNSVVPVLVRALEQAKSGAERAALARALGELGPAAAEAVPVLTKCLGKAADPGERRAMLLALGEMGPAARSAVPVLLASLEGPCEDARHTAAKALVRLGPTVRVAVVQCLARKKAESRTPEDRLVREVVRRLRGREGRIGVNDEGGCFSARALRESTREINSLAQVCDVEVLVETVPRLNAEGARRAAARCRELGKHGVYVLLDREGPTVQVHVTEALRRQGLTGEELSNRLTAGLRGGDFDRALLEGVRAVLRFERQAGNKK